MMQFFIKAAHAVKEERRRFSLFMGTLRRTKTILIRKKILLTSRREKLWTINLKRWVNTIGMAALHFSAASKHHLAAVVADDEGNVEVTARHAFQAFRHQLNAVQYAEIAVMDNEGLDEDLESS